MTPVSLNPSGDDPLQGQNQFFISPNSQDSPTFFNIFDPTQTIEFGELRHQNDHHDHKMVLGDGSSSNNQQFSFNSPQPMMEDSSSTRDPTYKIGEEEIKNGHGSAKWMSSKMRLMKKMMRPGSTSSTDKAINTTTTTATATATATPRPRFQYHRHENRYSQRSPRNNNNNNSNSTTIRVCSDCNTSTTPLWRSGPMGPKSLCNACGIRQRKARRAMLESQNGLTTPKNIAATTKTRVYNKEKKPRTNKYKPTETTTASSSSSQSVDKHETSAMSLKNNSDSEQVLPWDETAQAALLLMSLSYGFVPIMNY